MTAGGVEPTPTHAEAPEPSGRPLGIWELAWPSMAAFGLQSVVGLVNLVIVASLGTEAVAAVGVALQVHFALFAVLAAVTTGTIALIARAVGGADWPEADRILRVSVVLGAALGAAAMAAIPFCDGIIAAFGVAPSVVRAGGSYLRILLAFNVPFAVGLVVASALRGAGDARTPLFVGLVMNVVNLVACWALVYGKLGAPRLGTDGSALAAGLAFSVAMALYLAMWLRDDLVIARGPWSEGLTHERSARLLRIGIPTALEQGAWQVGLWIFLRLVAEYGTEPVSAYQIGVRILSFSFVPGLGFSFAAATLVGQHLGAQRVELAVRSGWRASAGAIGVMGGLGLAIIMLARPVAGWFGAAGAETVDLTVTFIYILGAAQPLMAVEFALGGALRGAGDTRFPLVAILTGLFVFRLGGALLVFQVFEGSVVAVWCCLLADYTVKAAMLARRFASGHWQRVRV